MTLLQEGDIIELRDGHTVYAEVQQHFLYDNRKGDFTPGRGNVTIGGELAYLAGRYIVYKTALDGGGTGMGRHDIYPNGHHVYCERADDHAVRVDFYQTGSFTAMIQDIEPVGRATRKWVEQ